MRVRIEGIEIGSHPRRRHGPIVIQSFTPAGAEVRSQDHNRLGRDGVIPGRDFLGAATWVFELYTNVRYASQAREVYSALQRVWQDASHRGRSGSLIALDYELDGTNQWRRVYGRPRAFDPASGDVLMTQGRAHFGVEFEVMDPRYFSGSESGLYERTLHHVGDLVGGWVFPAEFPLMSTQPVGQREGALTNEGTTNTPLHVTFTGPVENPLLRGSGGWQIGYRGTLQRDERVEIDPMRHTVTRYDGDGRSSSAFSGLSDRRWQLSRLSIPPGTTNVFFSGVDPSNRSTAVVSWRDAHQSI